MEFKEFNLNKYLRSFVRSDITNEYEAKCLEIVDKYKDSKTTKVLMDMIADFNLALSELGNDALSEQKKFEDRQ
jgi:hypothetical protein